MVTKNSFLTQQGKLFSNFAFEKCKEIFIMSWNKLISFCKKILWRSLHILKANSKWFSGTAHRARTIFTTILKYVPISKQSIFEILLEILSILVDGKEAMGNPFFYHGIFNTGQIFGSCKIYLLAQLKYLSENLCESNPCPFT